MSLRGYATDKGLEVLKHHLKDKVKYFALVGDASSINQDLDTLIESSTTEYKDIEQYIFSKSDIGAAYYDKDGVLTFELSIDYEGDYKKYTYGICILDVDNTLISVIPTPKILKVTGIGGNIVYKIAVAGEAGSIVFDKSDIRRSTQEEAEGGLDVFSLMTPLRTRQYVDTCVVSEEEGVSGKDNKLFMTSLRTKQHIDGRLATQAEAEAGEEEASLMSPLRTKQYIDGRLATQEEADAGEDFLKLITPKVLKKVIKDNLAEISEYIINNAKTKPDLAVLPIGFIYTQFPDQAEPSKLFDGLWENISSQYANCFFRAEGDDANPFGGGSQLSGIPNITGSFTTAQRSGYITSDGCFYRNDLKGITYAYHQHWGGARYHFSAAASSRVFNHYIREIRPLNMTIRLWKRIK